MYHVLSASRVPKRFVAAILLTLSVATSACTDLLAPLLANGRRMAPSAIYARWWAMTEACSGRTGDFASIKWYRAPGAFVSDGGSAVSGYYSSFGNFIVVTDSLADVGSGVRHEMLHALLGVDGHPRDQFLGACRGLVECVDRCARDGGPWSAPAPFVTLPAPSLIVTENVQLLPPETDGQRWVDLRLSVRNPQPHAVFAVPIGAHFTFGSDVRQLNGPGLMYSLPVADSSQLFFGASETK